MSENDLIPPASLIEELRIGGGDFKAVGEEFVRRFIDNGWIKPDSVVVDIGCGLGRMARPLTEVLSDKGRYAGFDINRQSIEWCQERYWRFRNFSFAHVDAKSVFYNPNGQTDARSVRFPAPDASVDFINMSSVFTHILPKDSRAYFAEIARLLRPNGRCSLTFFLLDPTAHAAMKDPGEDIGLLKGAWFAVEHGYVRRQDIPEAVVLQDEEFVRQQLQNVCLEVTDVARGHWCGQIRGPASFAAQPYQDNLDAVKLA